MTNKPAVYNHLQTPISRVKDNRLSPFEPAHASFSIHITDALTLFHGNRYAAAVTAGDQIVKLIPIVGADEPYKIDLDGKEIVEAMSIARNNYYKDREHYASELYAPLVKAAHDAHVIIAEVADAMFGDNDPSAPAPSQDYIDQIAGRVAMIEEKLGRILNALTLYKQECTFDKAPSDE